MVAVTALMSVAVVLMLVSAVMLVIGAGASALWIAFVTVGIALVVVERYRGRPRLGS